jgi:serine/threonine-protein kinase ATR
MIDIRTYAVMPLNEECGLLEWVANTHALKNILEKGYQRQGKRIWVSTSIYLLLEKTDR